MYKNVDECPKKNLKLLEKYKILIDNKGLTEVSCKAFLGEVILYLRFIEDKKIPKTKVSDVESFLHYCKTDRKNGDQTLQRKIVALNSFYKLLIKKDILEDFKNPMDKIDSIKVRKKIRDHLTIDELKQVFDYIDKTNDLRAGAMFSLFFSSGIRLSELFQLNKDSMNFNDKTFVVLGKGQKYRNCIYSEDCKQRILKYLNSRTDDKECLFLSRENNRLSKRAIQVAVKNIIKNAGIKKNMSPHNLRHSCAMFFLTQGLELYKIQKILGHSSVISTQIYAHNTISDVQDEVNNIFDNNQINS